MSTRSVNSPRPDYTVTARLRVGICDPARGAGPSVANLKTVRTS